MNVVMTQTGEFIELQGTVESKPLSRTQCNDMWALAEGGIKELIALQQKALGW